MRCTFITDVLIEAHMNGSWTLRQNNQIPTMFAFAGLWPPEG